MKSNIVIVGGGIIGLYSAYLLALRGIKPTLIDKGEFGHESSWAAGGILTPLLPWHYNEEVLFLTNNAEISYKQLADTLTVNTGIDIEFWQCGLTVITKDTSPIINWCQDHGTDYIHVDHPKTHVHLSKAAQLRTPRLIKALTTKLTSLGVKLLSNTEVNQCRSSKQRITGVDTNKGFIPCDNLVWCTGAWAPQIKHNSINITAPNITPIKGQMIALQHNNKQLLSNIIFKDGYYLIPRRDGLILVGSTLEDVGYEKSITAAAKQLLLEKSIDMVPALASAKITHHWAGLRPSSKNNLPTIGPHPKIEGLIYNCGHHRYGVTMAPKSAEIVVDWIINQGNSLNQEQQAYSLIN